MINIADLPAVHARLVKDAATVEPAASLQEQNAHGPEPEQAPSYPSKRLVLVGGRYQALSQEK